MSKKRKDSPIFRMVVEQGALVPADAYTQERLDTYRINSVVNVRMTQDINPPLLNKYWSILSLAVKQCRTPWRSSDEASDAIKRAFGVVTKGHTASGIETEEVGSLTDLDGPELEDFFEGAMALLYRITGVDPETLWKETPDPGIDSPAIAAETDPLSVPAATAGDDSDHGAVEASGGGRGLESPPAAASLDTGSSSQLSLGDDEVGGSAATPPSNSPGPLSSADQPPLRRIDPNTGPNEPGRELVEPPVMRHENIVGSIEADVMEVSPLAVGPQSPDATVTMVKADERAMVNSADPMNWRELKQEAIQKVIDLALELHAQTEPVLTPAQITKTMAENRELWVAKMPGHPQFVRTVFETAAKVMRGELPRPAATKYLFSLKDG